MVSSFLSYSGEEQKMKNGNVLWFWFEIMGNFKCYMCFCVYEPLQGKQNAGHS